jgi:hypothetical protein
MVPVHIIEPDDLADHIPSLLEGRGAHGLAAGAEGDERPRNPTEDVGRHVLRRQPDPQSVAQPAWLPAEAAVVAVRFPDLGTRRDP